jgi:hypothetical protein
MPHIFEKLSMKDTTLFQNSLESEVYTKSYGLPKSRGIPILGISKLPTRES